jgi:AcrR family transcriptional regulator
LERFYLPFGKFVISASGHPESATRQHLLRAALKRFAECGYAAASVSRIVDAARVSKPALYYHFGDKAGIFRALVDQAHEERYRIMQEAAERGRTVAEKLEEITAAVFEFSLANQELMRLAFATAFAAPGEVPGGMECHEKGRRNYEFIRSIVAAGQAAGELDRRFSVDELAMGIFGQLNTYVMVRLLVPDCPLDRKTAKVIVELFMKGAVSKQPGQSKSTGVRKG